MKVTEMIAALAAAPPDADVICGESHFTMYVVSDATFHMMFIGMKGSAPVHVPIDKPLSGQLPPVPAI